jgi:hypothetical protein
MTMDVVVCNPQKGRLETIKVNITDENTTWFDSDEGPVNIRMITDFNGGLIVSRYGRDYPILIYDVERAAINFSRKKAENLLRQAMI